jgi:hypothetical protein
MDLAEQATVESIIRRMRIARWLTKATDTHSEYVILLAFSRQNGDTNAPQYYDCAYIPFLFRNSM